jgi:FkbM family methyltransferase
LIFDVGANHGDKTAPFNLIAKKVVAFEPDNSNVEFLSYRFRNNKNVLIEQTAISNEVGETEFFVVNHGSGLNTINNKRKDELDITETYQVNITTLDLMINKYGMPDFIKIDVEGHELKVLEGLSHSINMISFEANLPQFAPQTIECLEKIYNLNSDYIFNYGFDIGIEKNKWLDLEQIKSIINNTDLKYLNVYCKIDNSY